MAAEIKGGGGSRGEEGGGGREGGRRRGVRPGPGLCSAEGDAMTAALS